MDWPRDIFPLDPCGFQVWYTDGRVRSSDDAPWWRMKRRGVQVVVIHYPGGLRNVFVGYDEYTYPGSKHTLLGQEIDLDAYKAIHKRALVDSWSPST